MSGNVADLTDRRRKDTPDYDIEAWITGIRLPNNTTSWKVIIEGESDNEMAAGILERAAEVLRDNHRERIPT